MRPTPSVLPVPWLVAGVALVGAHSMGTFVRNRVWLSEETLWEDVVRKSPANGRAWMNYGLTQMSQGRYGVASDHFRRAVELVPNYAPVHINLGIVTSALGDTVAADGHFLRALELAPDYAQGRFYYGRYLLEVGRGPEALPQLRGAIAGAPSFAPARHLLLGVYYVLGSEAEMRRLAEETLALAPGDLVAAGYLEGRPPQEGEGSTPYLRGVSLTGQRRHLAAGIAYRSHLSEDGGDANALNNLGWSLANLGFNEAAVPIFRQALALDPAHPLAGGNLAWALGRTTG